MTVGREYNVCVRVGSAHYDLTLYLHGPDIIGLKLQINQTTQLHAISTLARAVWANHSQPTFGCRTSSQKSQTKEKQESLFPRHVGLTVIAHSTSPKMVRWQLNWGIAHVLIG